jgi:predicted MFS family arabinose efflux permease
VYREPSTRSPTRDLFALAGALAIVGTTAGFVLFPLYLASTVGLSASTIVGLFLVNAILSAVLYRPMGRWADRFGDRRFQVAGLGSRSVMHLLLVVPVLAGLPAAILFLALAGISWAVVNVTGPAALFRGMQIRNKGQLVGRYSMAAGLDSLVGALFGGLVAQ